MKKVLLSILSLAAIYSSSAQVSISNGSFEIWEKAGTKYEKPTDWNGTDKLISDLGIFLMALKITPQQQVFEVSDKDNVHTGDKSLMLMSRFLGDTTGVVPAMLANGKIEIDLAKIGTILAGDPSKIMEALNITGGTPLAGRKLDSVSVWMKGKEGFNIDSVGVIIQCKRKVGDDYITVGTGAIATNPSNEDFTKYTSIINYTTEDKSVDTVLISLISSITPSDELLGFHDSNSVYIDDVQIFTSVAPTNIQINNNLHFSIYPNPVNDELYIKNALRHESALINIFNGVGQLIHQEKFSSIDISINTSQYPIGTYYYDIVVDDKKQTGKFIKK